MMKITERLLYRLIRKIERLLTEALAADECRELAKALHDLARVEALIVETRARLKAKVMLPHVSLDVGPDFTPEELAAMAPTVDDE